MMLPNTTRHRTDKPKSLNRSASITTVEYKKSLNYSHRKAEMDKINEENLKIAHKLSLLKSDLTKEQHLRDFRQHQKHKHNIEKIRKRSILPVHDGKLGRLPPIEENRRPYEKNESVDRKVSKDEAAARSSKLNERKGHSLTPLSAGQQ